MLPICTSLCHIVGRIQRIQCWMHVLLSRVNIMAWFLKTSWTSLYHILTQSCTEITAKCQEWSRVDTVMAMRRDGQWVGMVFMMAVRMPLSDLIIQAMTSLLWVNAWFGTVVRRWEHCFFGLHCTDVVCRFVQTIVSTFYFGMYMLVTGKGEPYSEGA